MQQEAIPRRIRISRIFRLVNMDTITFFSYTTIGSGAYMHSAGPCLLISPIEDNLRL